MSDKKRAAAFALVEDELRDARCAVGRPYSDEFIWTHYSEDTLLDALAKMLERRRGSTSEAPVKEAGTLATRHVAGLLAMVRELTEENDRLSKAMDAAYQQGFRP